MARFRADRRKKFRAEWRQLAGLVGTCIGSTALAVLLDGAPALISAAVAGGSFTVLGVYWIIGDVHALTWAWGAVGEEQTGDLLARLPPDEWTVVHDVPTPGGTNWDHVLIGPRGVFVIETKNLAGAARAHADALRAGRLRFDGAGLRAAAASLADALGRGGGRPWVQAVVVIWGEFPQRRHVERNVVYLHSSELLKWLAEHPRRLDESRVHALRDALTNAAERIEPSESGAGS